MAILDIKKDFNPGVAFKNIFNKLGELIRQVNLNTEAIDALPVQPKVYKALLTQSGTNDPVATVLVNTLSGTPVWSYSSTGTYKATLTNEWTNLKTGIFTTSTADGFTEAYVNNVDEIEVITFNNSGVKTNGLLYQQLITIEVYPS